jgi:hypothetical protein
MANGPLRDFETGAEQKKEIIFKVQCRGGTRGPQAGSIADLARMSAVVRHENTIDNKTYGLWAEGNTLGPTEEIRVGDFEWIEPGNRAAGFRVSIDSAAQYGVLNIDVGRINLVPGLETTIEKQGVGALQRCGTSPCVESIGDANNKVIRIRLGVGDPVFTFTGFSSPRGLEGIPAEGIVLTPEQPAYPVSGDTIVQLNQPLPGELRSITFNSYEQSDNGFSISMTTDPASIFPPGATASFNLQRMGFSADSVRVEDIPACVEQCVIEKGDGYECRDVSDQKNPGESNDQLRSRLSAETLGDARCYLGLCTGSSTNICCPRTATASGGTGGAVTDISSESLSLPATISRPSQLPLITGFVACSATTPCPSGQNCVSGECQAASSAPASGGGSSPASNVGAQVSGALPAGVDSCYRLDGNRLAIKTVGAANQRISVTGLERSETIAVAKLSDAVGRTLVFTTERLEQYGVRIAYLEPGTRVTLSNINVNTGSGTITFDCQISGAPVPLEITIELLPMSLRTKNSTTMSVAGESGSAPDCASDVWQSCVTLRGGDRLIISPPLSSDKRSIRITDFETSRSSCAGKMPDESCPLPSGQNGVCWEPNIPGRGLDCYTDCRKQWVWANRAELIANTGKSIPDESMFCINDVPRARCGGTKNQYWDTSAGLCASGKKCCTKGDGRVLPPPRVGGGGGGGGSAACTSAHPGFACIDVGSQRRSGETDAQLRTRLSASSITTAERCYTGLCGSHPTTICCPGTSESAAGADEAGRCPMSQSFSTAGGCWCGGHRQLQGGLEVDPGESGTCNRFEGTGAYYFAPANSSSQDDWIWQECPFDTKLNSIHRKCICGRTESTAEIVGSADYGSTCHEYGGAILIESIGDCTEGPASGPCYCDDRFVEEGDSITCGTVPAGDVPMDV